MNNYVVALVQAVCPALICFQISCYILLLLYHHYHHHHGKNTTAQCKLPECKSGICASGWKEKHHWRKLQWVKPPRVQVESLCQLLREKHHHRKLLPVTTTASTKCKGQGARCKGQDQHQRKSERDAATTWNSNHHHHQPAQDQTGVGGVHNAAIIATCVRAHNKSRAWKKLEWCALMHVAMIAASCTPPSQRNN